MRNLWAEIYRPKTLDDYVFTDTAQRKQVESWIQERAIPHILFSGSPGTGKTTLAKILINSLGVSDLDVMEINASRDNGVDYIRQKIEGFVSTMPFGDFKIVLLDEADFLSPNAQAVLRGLMETYSESSRFILTCNYPDKIMPALHSRTQGFHFEKVDENEFTARMAKILLEEGVEFDIETLDTFVKATYPDLRKCINLLQPNCTNKVLTQPKDEDKSARDYRLDVVALLKAGQTKQARELIISQIRLDEIQEFYTWTYNNLGLWSKTVEGQDEAIKTIARYVVQHALCYDPEINLSACLIELSNLEKK